MMKMIKAGMIAIAFTATTSLMAQEVDATTQATTKAMSETKDVNGGEQKKFTCPNCGTEIALPHNRRGHHNGRHEKKHWGKGDMKPDTVAGPHARSGFSGHPGMGPGFHGGSDKMPKFEAPEVGSVQDTLPRGAMPMVNDGKQVFVVFGYVYEPVVEQDQVKYKMTGRIEKK